MSITATHADYDKHITTWNKLDDVCGGQEVIKEKRETYLPKPSLFTSKNDPDGKARYEEYLQRAIFPGVTGRTLASHIGLAFGKSPVFNRPDELEYLERNADGAGRSIYQCAQRATRLINRNYRCGIYVDFPNVAPSRSKAEERTKGAFPMIHIIRAGAIKDWDYIIVGNQKKLSFVKLLETVKVRNGFSVESKDQYRILELSDTGSGYIYTVQIFTKNEKGEWVEGGKYIPTDYHGNPWDYIPFSFCGAMDNSDEVGTAPLYELASMELSYYCSTADVEESAFIVGQPTLCFPSITPEQYAMVKESGASVGSRSGIPTDAKMVQAEKNGLAYERMNDKWNQMKELGARLIEVGSANKTATQADNESSVQHSVLSLVVANVSEAFTNALRWCAKFAMPEHDFKTDELSFTIAQDFNKPKYDPTRSKLIYEACLAGELPMYVWYHYEQTGTFPEDKWEDIVKKIEKREDGTEDE
ncbi:DUF4055 domain-containing protein [Acinetobacter sp. RF15A]|uniref:DUF4055 domain-containing protein n=1 Tax=unclassified Acinetobacter TaxID=196816 RepID=UPI00118F7EAA|nr:MULTISPECIES: DUF4055 domain-containing protein [unclassified Acinetobacter]TSH74900.1 DUF4055 domain-containing protein [Acinetobacter sp. RF15A]TSI20403.1 DUF4055 domain-containing protein [Acinetobacter sp. RF15B]